MGQLASRGVVVEVFTVQYRNPVRSAEDSTWAWSIVVVLWDRRTRSMVLLSCRLLASGRRASIWFLQPADLRNCRPGSSRHIPTGPLRYNVEAVLLPGPVSSWSASSVKPRHGDGGDEQWSAGNQDVWRVGGIELEWSPRSRGGVHHRRWSTGVLED